MRRWNPALSLAYLCRAEKSREVTQAAGQAHLRIARIFLYGGRILHTQCPSSPQETASCVRPSSFLEHFASLSDPRSFHAPNQRHDLLDMIVIAVCAVICGAEGWEDIEEYGKAQADWFAEFLDLPNGIPSHDTFRRVLSRLDPDELTECFVSWTTALSDLSGGEIWPLMAKPCVIPMIKRPRRRRSTW